jgi:myelin transcription factor 1-like protein
MQKSYVILKGFIIYIGYNPHPGYDMVLRPEYSNGYPGYGLNPYQSSGPYGGGPGMYSSSISGPYSPSTSCYTMQSPQNLLQFDKLLSKDG